MSMDGAACELMRAGVLGEELYHRARVVCCHVWGVAPWEFDARCVAGELAGRDVEELLCAMGHHPAAAWGVGYVHHRDVAAARERERAALAAAEQEALDAFAWEIVEGARGCEQAEAHHEDTKARREAGDA
jgi:ribosomal protein L12E/L44/L45/RPP1/RPP2